MANKTIQQGMVVTTQNHVITNVFPEDKLPGALWAIVVDCSTSKVVYIFQLDFSVTV